jgi:hypothetical protein
MKKKLHNRRKKFKVNVKHLLIALAFIFLFIAILAAIKQEQSGRPLARDYFKIEVVDIKYVNLSSQSVDVKRVVLNITAVGGEATSIILQVNYGVEGERVSAWPHLNKGESWCNEYTTFTFKGCTFPIENGEIVLEEFITIGCKETKESTITLRVPISSS